MTTTGATTSFAYTISDALMMTRRNLLKYIRVPALLVFSTIQPVMFVLLFRYVFGGAIDTGGVQYVDFLMPGVFIQTVVFGSTQTGVGLADDLSKGMIDRFRSLPMARSAVLAGRTMSDAVRNVFVVTLMVLVGLLIGFRFHAGLFPFLAAIPLAVLFGHAFSWISASIGLALKDPESVQTASFVWLFPLVFASAVFVPVETMPGWLQGFAKVNPITSATNALRALSLGGPTAVYVWRTFAWVAAILLVFVPVAVRRYRRAL